MARTEPGELDIDDATRIRGYGRRALEAVAPQREAVYGEMLATCAHCHVTLRDR